MNRKGVRLVHPQNVTASDVDGGENGSDVLVDPYVFLPQRFHVGQDFCVRVAAWGCSRSEANRA